MENTVKEISGATYKKVDNGKWVKLLSNGEERPVASSGMLKKLREYRKSFESQMSAEMQSFEAYFDCSYVKGGLGYKVLLGEAIAERFFPQPHIQEIQNQLYWVDDELKQVRKVLRGESKNKRELLAGKQELDVEDLSPIVKDLECVFKKAMGVEPVYRNIKDIFPTITTDNYRISTEADWEMVKDDVDDNISLFDIWQKMKNRDKYKWSPSLNSSSEYLVNESNGDVYRFAYHWGTVGSRNWNLIGEVCGTWQIGKANIKDFVRKDVDWYNPQYIPNLIKSIELVLEEYAFWLEDNPEFYLTDKATRYLKNCANSTVAFHLFNSPIPQEERDRLMRKYSFAFEKSVSLQSTK